MNRGFTVGDLLITIIVVAVALFSIKTFKQKNENTTTIIPQFNQSELTNQYIRC